MTILNRLEITEEVNYFPSLLHRKLWSQKCIRKRNQKALKFKQSIKHMAMIAKRDV